MENCKGTVILRCDCNCTMLVVDKYEFSGEVSYNICIEDSYYYNEFNGLKGRIKRAFQVLFGKPIIYNDIYIDGDERVIQFRDELNELINK